MPSTFPPWLLPANSYSSLRFQPKWHFVKEAFSSPRNDLASLLFCTPPSEGRNPTGFAHHCTLSPSEMPSVSWVSQKFSSDSTNKLPKTRSACFSKASLDFEKIGLERISRNHLTPSAVFRSRWWTGKRIHCWNNEVVQASYYVSEFACAIVTRNSTLGCTLQGAQVGTWLVSLWLLCCLWTETVILFIRSEAEYPAHVQPVSWKFRFVKLGSHWLMEPQLLLGPLVCLGCCFVYLFNNCRGRGVWLFQLFYWEEEVESI